MCSSDTTRIKTSCYKKTWYGPILVTFLLKKCNNSRCPLLSILFQVGFLDEINHIYIVHCPPYISLTDRSWETERIVGRWLPHPKLFLQLKWRFIYIIQFAKVIWSHGGHFWPFWPLFGSKNELFAESHELPKRIILSEIA